MSVPVGNSEAVVDSGTMEAEAEPWEAREAERIDWVDRTVLDVIDSVMTVSVGDCVAAVSVRSPVAASTLELIHVDMS